MDRAVAQHRNGIEHPVPALHQDREATAHRLAHADQTDAQAGTTGTETADVIGVSAPLDVTASLDTDAGEALDATATGVDALGGDDTLSADAAIATDATATAVITSDPRETTAKANAVAVKGGDGADAVAVNDATTATASPSPTTTHHQFLGFLASMMRPSPEAPSPPDPRGHAGLTPR